MLLNIMDTNNISTLPSAQNYLKMVNLNENILEDIKNIIYSWNYKSEFNLEVIKEDLDCMVNEVISLHFDNRDTIDIVKAVNCIIYNEIYENLMPLIKGSFSKEDLYLYEKCQYFCKQNITPGEFGSCVYNSLPFTAAIVELSVLDNYKSPLEKINCLCYTYDLIFADLKLALASLISKYSDKELEIPIINNDEVIPILTLVVIKSKLLYLSSNLFYIKLFGARILKENNGMSGILNAFETASRKLMESDTKSTRPIQNKLASHLNILETMEIMFNSENPPENENKTVNLEDEEKKRLVALITTSTTEKDFIPFDLPKVFS